MDERARACTRRRPAQAQARPQKRALISGIAILVLLLVSACANGKVASRRNVWLAATPVGDDTSFHVNNLAKALMAKNPNMTLKEATAEAQRRAAAEASPSPATTWADEYQRQQKAASEAKFLANLDKSQRGD